MPEFPDKRESADDILARVDRLLNRDAPKKAAEPLEIPVLSDVLVPGKGAPPAAAPSIDRELLARELVRQLTPAIETRIANDVRRQLEQELTPAMNRAVDAAVATVRADLMQAVQAAVLLATRNYDKNK